MEEKQIKTVKNWLEPKSIRDIQIFIRFANFYHQFIHKFSRIVAPRTSILKILGSEILSVLQTSKNEVLSRKNNYIESGKDNNNNKTVRKNGGTSYLTPKAKIAFAKWKKAFIKALILYHFQPNWYIWIEIDVSGYAIGGVISQLTLEIE